MKKFLLVTCLLLASVSAFAADPTFATAAKSPDGPSAATTAVTASTFTAGAGDLVYCAAAMDDNGSSTHITGITVSGSPSYSTAWAKLATDGAILVSNQGAIEFWWGVTSSGFTNQAATVTISSSERVVALCNSIHGQASTPIPATNSSTQIVGTTSTLTVTSSGHDNSKYIGFFGCFSNVAQNGFSSGAPYTDDGCSNCSNVANQWVHLAVAHSTNNVTPAGNTVVNFTQVNSCSNPMEIAMEIAVATASSIVRSIRISNE